MPTTSYPSENREVNELTLMVHALTADVLVAVILGPCLLRFLQLAADAVAAQIREHRAHPVIEHAGLEFKANPESDRLSSMRAMSVSVL